MHLPRRCVPELRIELVPEETKEHEPIVASLPFAQESFVRLLRLAWIVVDSTHDFCESFAGLVPCFAHPLHRLKAKACLSTTSLEVNQSSERAFGIHSDPA